MDSSSLAILLTSAYVLGIILLIILLNLKNCLVKPINNAKINKYGIIFYSFARHKIKVGAVKIMEMDKSVYLKRDGKTIILKNVFEPTLRGEYLYFKANGNVKIIFNAKNFYKYFNIEIKSSAFDLTELKQKAIMDILNNLFNLNNCVELKHYLKIITNILNVHITDNKITVKKNKFNLTFQLIYKLNNTIKKININECF